MKNLISKFKAFYNTTYGMLIVISWVVLLICLIIKLLGGNWFELGTDNEYFISFCNYVDNTQWLKMLLACIICIGSVYIIECLLLNKKKLSPKELALYIPLIVIGSISSWKLQFVSLICQILYFIILPILQTKGKWKRVVFINIFVIFLQAVSIIFRNLSCWEFNQNRFIFQVLIQVDYYLMLILTYLYKFNER